MNIVDVFLRHAEHLVIDKKLKDRVHNFERNFVNRSVEHSEFFSGNLLGVHKVRFHPSDSDEWFDEVLGVDDIELTNELHALPTINSDFNVSSDVFYICCIALVHLVSNSKLSNDDKKHLMIDILLVMQYKMLTSKLSQDFKYRADREIMEAVKEAMSKKYHIKKFGSWYALLYNRAEDIIASNSIHMRYLHEGRPDERLLYVITDAKSRINSLVKNHWELIEKIRASDSKIKDSNIFIQTSEGTEIGDLTRELSVYRNYIHSVIGDPNNFIKDEIVTGVIGKAMLTLSMPMFKDLLVKFSDVYNAEPSTKTLVDDILTHAFGYIYHTLNMGSNTNVDLAYVVAKLRGIYMSSKTSSALAKSIREDVELLIRSLIPGRSNAAVASARTALMLYIVIRTLTRRHFVH